MNAAHGYASPHFYDLASDHLGPHQPDVRFYLGRASRAGRALEVGAGTGRIAVEVAAEGVHVYCVEPSNAMRSALLTKAAQRPEVHPRTASTARAASTRRWGTTATSTTPRRPLRRPRPG